MMLASLAAIGTTPPAQAQLIDLTPILNTLVDLDARVTANTSSLISLDADVSLNASITASHTLAIDTLNTQVSVNTGDISILNGQVSVLNTQVTTNTNAINALDTRVTNVENRVTNVENRVTNVENGLAAANVRIDANVDSITALDTRVTANTTTLANHTTSLANLSGQVGAIQTEVQSLAQSLGANGMGLVRQANSSAPVTVAAQTGGNVVTINGTDGDRRISGLAAGVAANDAVNVAQMQAGDASTLAAANDYTDRSMAGMVSRMQDYTNLALQQTSRALRKDMQSMAASSAALAGLPQAFIPGKGMVGAAVGGNGGEVSFAMGLSKAFNVPSAPVVRAGAAVDTRRGQVSYNASVGLHF